MTKASSINSGPGKSGSRSKVRSEFKLPVLSCSKSVSFIASFQVITFYSQHPPHPIQMEHPSIRDLRLVLSTLDDRLDMDFVPTALLRSVDPKHDHSSSRQHLVIRIRAALCSAQRAGVCSSFTGTSHLHCLTILSLPHYVLVPFKADSGGHQQPP